MLELEVPGTGAVIREGVSLCMIRGAVYCKDCGDCVGREIGDQEAVRRDQDAIRQDVERFVEYS